MIHLRARQRLPELLDEALDPRDSNALRAHVIRCSRCQRVLAELQACDRLLAQLPSTLVPLGAPRKELPRLALLSRWATAPAPRARVLWPQLGATALLAAMTAALLILAGTGGQPGVAGLGPARTPALVALAPGIQVLPAGSWR